MSENVVWIHDLVLPSFANLKKKKKREKKAKTGFMIS